MSSDGLPVEAEPPISDELRERGVEVLKGLLAQGKVDLDRFHEVLDRLLSVHGVVHFAAVMRSLPPPVAFTPSERRRHDPFEIATSMGEVRLDGRWQVGRLTKITTGMGAVTIDLRDAEFDEWEVEIVAHTNMGAITVIAPRGLDVRLVGRSSGVTSSIEPPIPGFPVVRLSATSDMGAIRVVHEAEQARRRRRLRRRRPELES
jgi:hypothetical protein